MKSLDINERRESIKWAIVGLVNLKNSKSMKDMQKRNIALSKILKPFAHLHNITILMLSEYPFTNDVKKSFTKDIDGLGNIEYIDVSHTKSNNVTHFYSWMCRFFSLYMYDFIKHYDYYIRVDSDIYIKSISYDIFQWVESNQIEYAYGIRKIESHPYTIKTYPLFVEDYTLKCNVSSGFSEPSLSVAINFYNNFHIGKVGFFIRPDVYNFLKQSNHHEDNNRWGDSTIEAYSLRLFMNPDALQMIPNITYIHDSHHMTISTDIQRKYIISSGSIDVSRGGFFLKDRESPDKWKVNKLSSELTYQSSKMIEFLKTYKHNKNCCRYNIHELNTTTMHNVTLQ
jgi:hypothetical protein